MQYNILCETALYKYNVFHKLLTASYEYFVAFPKTIHSFLLTLFVTYAENNSVLYVRTIAFSSEILDCISFQSFLLYLGLCRTCEVFGVSKFIIGSMRYLEDKTFEMLSVTSHKWINIEEVEPFIKITIQNLN